MTRAAEKDNELNESTLDDLYFIIHPFDLRHSLDRAILRRTRTLMNLVELDAENGSIVPIQCIFDNQVMVAIFNVLRFPL